MQKYTRKPFHTRKHFHRDWGTCLFPGNSIQMNIQATSEIGLYNLLSAHNKNLHSVVKNSGVVEMIPSLSKCYNYFKLSKLCFL